MFAVIRQTVYFDFWARKSTRIPRKCPGCSPRTIYHIFQHIIYGSGADFTPGFSSHVSLKVFLPTWGYITWFHWLVPSLWLKTLISKISRGVFLAGSRTWRLSAIPQPMLVLQGWHHKFGFWLSGFCFRGEKRDACSVILILLSEQTTETETFSYWAVLSF